MIIRIVHMHFTDGSREEFLSIFRDSRMAIRNMDGCEYLELIGDTEDAGHFMTVSHWLDAEALKKYRNSELFKSVWSRVKPLFSQRSTAFSMEKIIADGFRTE